MSFSYDCPVERILVDRHNIAVWDPFITEHLSKPSNFVGFDIETSQRDAHEGIKKLMKTDDEGYSKGKKLIFDFKRTKIVGASFYFGHTAGTKAFYVNFDHADKENTINIGYLLRWMDLAKANNVNNIIHNVQYEYAVFRGSYNYVLPPTLCSMQLCVTAYGPDEYKKADLAMAVSNGVKSLIPEIERAFTNYEHGNLTFQQQEVLGKFCAKSGGAAHSYEGIIKGISYGYGLKKAVKTWFGYQMEEFKDTLGDSADMESLTGQQVLAYGADDAIWAYRLFFRVYSYLQQINPDVIATYLGTENPITRVFAETTIGGMKVNHKEIIAKRDEMRHSVAEKLVEFKQLLRQHMPTELPPMHEKLAKYEKWYKPESHQKYFNYIWDWLNMSDQVSDYELCTQIKCATGNAWIEDVKGVGAKPKAVLSINHYMAQRYIMFTIFDLPCSAAGGKINSDKLARAEMAEKLGGHPLLDIYEKLSSAEQAFKLYITPYLCLVDPETGLMHPQLSSMLATRRTSCSNPNGQQLAKRGDSVFVRGFFQADDPDSVIVSADWSAIELVGVAANSQDPEFLAAYGQRPHKDLHTAAAMGVLGLSVDEFKELPNKKDMRTVLGKGSNFEYWYSGWLMNTAKKMGWDLEQTAEAVRGYTSKFPVAENWRLALIEELKRNGFVKIADHHIRTRFEATQDWADIMWQVFDSYGSSAILDFAREAIKRIQRRACNQGVNFAIQGLCAALAKQTILRVIDHAKKENYAARFMLLIHDELLFSVPRKEAAKFCDFLYNEMIQDSPMFPNVKIDSSVAVGYTFQPFDKVNAPFGQIELHEMQKGVPVIPEDRWEAKATAEERDLIIDYLTIGRASGVAYA
ncbi:hypothetical protein EAb13_CDS0075 [Acinetobacter phage EAb13]|nr:hypothetical protein EAb13_CDS0075 [Acinetobacter phage EAb13]